MNFRIKLVSYMFVFAMGTADCAADDIQRTGRRRSHPDQFAEQCAAYIAGKRSTTRSRPIADEGDSDRRQNPLKGDPEQQAERYSNCYADVLFHMNKIQQAVDKERDDPEKLQEYERACRVIVQALLQVSTDSPDALQYAASCIQLVAQIKLLRDPFWMNILHSIEAKVHRDVIAYAPHEFEASLPQDAPEADPRIQALLDNVLQERIDFTHIKDEDFNDLVMQLESDKQDTLSIALRLLEKVDFAHVGTKMFQPPLSQTAIDLYNQASVNEVKTMIQFDNIRHKREYLELEIAFRAVALTYLKAHDAGHPSGLKDAEILMKSKTMDTIVSWKQKHSIQGALESFAAIWSEISRRKRGDA